MPPSENTQHPVNHIFNPMGTPESPQATVGISAKGVISGYGNHTIDPSEKGIVVDPKHIIEIEGIAIYPEDGMYEHN